MENWDHHNHKKKNIPTINIHQYTIIIMLSNRKIYQPSSAMFNQHFSIIKNSLFHITNQHVSSVISLMFNVVVETIKTTAIHGYIPFWWWIFTNKLRLPGRWSCCWLHISLYLTITLIITIVSDIIRCFLMFIIHVLLLSFLQQLKNSRPYHLFLLWLRLLLPLFVHD